MDDISIGLSNLLRILDGKKGPGKLNLSVLSHITENFCDNRKIGEGGCGHVYKGILPNGKMVAVKKLFKSHTIDEKMFQQEVTTMMSVKHQNIVGFIGFCSHTEQEALQITSKHILADERERLLCFEYISNGTLANHVTDELRGLEWDARFQIIRGICEGLHHLHYMEKGIIHMDLKPANILLDHGMVPKITDFGISRLGDETKTMSQERLCSLGYCAPEYQLHGEMSVKSDIYSLGVIIMEIVTGTRKNNPGSDFETIIRKVCRRWRHRWNKSVKHTSLLEWQQQVTRCLKLAQRCKNLNPTERPDIQDIICELGEINNQCMDISDSSKSAAEQEKTFLEDMLGIEPLELQLFPKLNKQISHSIQLANDTDDYIAFMITFQEIYMTIGALATRQLQFHVHPNKHVVPPRSSCSITITLETLKKPLQEECVELCVNSTRVDKGFTTKDITADLFKEQPDNKVVDMVNLMVSVHPPKQLLIVKPDELRYGPIEMNKILPCLVKLTNMTDDHVAFTCVLPQQGKVIYYHEMMGTGIMPPWSTQGVVVDMLVEEAVTEMMQCKDRCIVQSVVVDKGLRDDDVSMEFFDDQAGVHEMELDIVFADKDQAPLSMRHSKFDDRRDWKAEDELLELLGDRTMLQSSFLIDTELLHIYPAKLDFASEGGANEYINLANKTDEDVIYAINYYERRREDEGEDEGDKIADERGVMLPQSIRTVSVPCENKRHYQVGVMMISGSHRYRTADDFFDNYTHDKREELMSQVRAEGGKAHEVLLPCVLVRARSHPKSVATDYNERHKVTLSMDDENGLGIVECMDVHPTEPWIVSGHRNMVCCIWKMDPETGACKERIMSTMAGTSISDYFFKMSSVKFIARMQWVVCAEYHSSYIAVFTYADNRLTEIKRFQADSLLISLAVHPTLPYLLSSSESLGNLIQLWDWDMGWICIRIFKCSGTYKHFRGASFQTTFDPKDAYSFASLNYSGEINLWSIHYETPITSFRGDTVAIAYCNTGPGMQRMLAMVGHTGRIEMLDTSSNTARVQTLKSSTENERCLPPSLIACHPTLPLLATTGALWNYTSYGLRRVCTFSCPYSFFEARLGFIDSKGFQRLVVATEKTIQIVDILDGATFPRG